MEAVDSLGALFQTLDRFNDNDSESSFDESWGALNSPDSLPIPLKAASNPRWDLLREVLIRVR